MDRKFDYNLKDTYTQEELDAILGQHKSFLNVDAIKTELESVKGELTPLKQKARMKHISGLVSDLTDSNKVTAAIKLADITDEDDDEGIKSKVAKAIKENTFLAKTGITDPAGIKKETLKSEESVKEQTVEEFQKEQRLQNL